MTRRVLFVLRGKLGETVVAFATVRAFADRYPDDDVTLLVRASYAPLFAREAGMRVIGFSSRIAMFAKLLRLRWFEAPFDALLVLLGAGPPIERLGRMVHAARKIFLDGRFADVYPEWPAIPRDHVHSEPAWRVAHAFEPGLAQPLRSVIPSLVAQRRPANIVAIAPVSDEARRSMGPATRSHADRGARAPASGMRNPGAGQSRRTRMHGLCWKQKKMPGCRPARDSSALRPCRPWSKPCPA